MIDGQGQLRKSLRRARRRIVWTRVVEAAGLGLLLWLIGFVVYLGLGRGLTDRSLLVGAAGLSAAAIAVLLVGVWRAPSLQGTARLLDRRLSLDERIESAFDTARSESAVAALLRNDAAAHLAGIDLRTAFPYRFRFRGTRLWWVMSILIGGVLALRWLILPQAWLPASVSSQVGRGAASQTSPALRPEEAAGDPTVRIAETTVPEGGAGMESRAREQGDRLASPAIPQTVGASEAGQEVSTGPPSSAVTPTGESARGGERESSVGAGGREPQPSESGDAEGADAVQRLSQTGSNGGVQSLSTAGTDTPADGAALSSRPGALEAMDWQGIETALRRERLPPGLERYVREYFLAISQSREQP